MQRIGNQCEPGYVYILVMHTLNNKNMNMWDFKNLTHKKQWQIKIQVVCLRHNSIQTK